jgi:hypothetical protein
MKCAFRRTLDQRPAVSMISHRDLYHNTMQVDVMSQRIGREGEVRGRSSSFLLLRL